MITNLSLPDDSKFDVSITLTLTRQRTKETLALIEKYADCYRWIQPHTAFGHIKANDMDRIATGHGVAHLRGKTAGERAKALIQIANPKFREELLHEARKMNLVI